jgi:hypothetical protein
VSTIERAIESGDLEALLQALRDGVPGYLPRTRAETALLSKLKTGEDGARSAS